MDLSHIPLTEAEKRIFGEQALRHPDGHVIEVGVGSAAQHPDNAATMQLLRLKKKEREAEAVLNAADQAVASATAARDAAVRAREEHESLMQSSAELVVPEPPEPPHRIPPANIPVDP